MARRYYNPTSKRNREEYYNRRFCVENAIRRFRRADMDAVSFIGGRPVININGCTVIAYRPDFLNIPLIEVEGSELSIRKTKSRLELLTGVKLRETKKIR